MKLWTGLAVALLIAQAFSAPAPDMPMAHGPGSQPSQNATLPIRPSSTLLSDPPITWSQGYLALVRSDAPNDTILSWDADTVDCPDAAYSVFLHPKNFGPEEITLCAPVEPETNNFTRTTDCACYNSLGPGQMSPCSLRIEFHPASDGTFRDTMRIQTNSWNSYGGFVRIPLSGTRVSTPAPPNVVITVNGTNAALFWHPIRSTEGGCPVSISGYLIFYSPANDGVFRLLSFTQDTTYVHSDALLLENGLSYQVIAGSQSMFTMRTLPPGLTVNQTLRELHR